MKLLEAYSDELADKAINYFIIDSGNHPDDRDFISYTWHRSRNNKISKNDLFIYRKPQNLSENGKFYLYGCGKFGPVIGVDRVQSALLKTFQFDNPIFQDELDNFPWTWKAKGNTWEHFWGQYRINQINKFDFIALLEIADNSDYVPEIAEKIVDNEVEIDNEDYFVPDSEAFTKTRPWQAAWSKRVKENYGFKCAVCGIETSAMLIGSHIMPVSVDANNRKNPRNGICLCVLHDKAFDRGYLTLSKEYTVVVSDRVRLDSKLSKILAEHSGKHISLPKKYKLDDNFLTYHRNNVFK